MSEITEEQDNEGTSIKDVLIAMGILVIGFLAYDFFTSSKPDACECAGVMGISDTYGLVGGKKADLLDDCIDAYGKAYNARLKCN